MAHQPRLVTFARWQLASAIASCLLAACSDNATPVADGAALNGTDVASGSGSGSASGIVTGSGGGISSSDGGSDAAPAPSDHLTRQGTQLFFNGAPYRYVGFNFPGLGGCEAITYGDAEMDAYFASLRPHSITRMWAFEAQGLGNLTRAIHSAEAHGQMLILSLADAAGYCGESDGRVAGEGSGKTSAWYAGGYKTRYIPWVHTVVGTFKDSPAVGMWELMNEGGTGHTDGQTLRALFDDAAATIKAIDPKHLVESGTLAEYVQATSDYALIHGGPNVDVGSLHEYDYDYLNSHTIVSPHLARTLSAMNSVGKPMIVGESGIKATSGGSCTTLSIRADAFRQKFDGYLASGVVGVNVWSYSKVNAGCTDTVNPDDPLMALAHGYVIH